MTREIGMRFSAVAGTQAGLGHDGGKSLVADRPEGVAGGQSLGFNGGQLLAAALGGCFWNDLHYAAEKMGLSVTVALIDVKLTLAGQPLLVRRAHIEAALMASDPARTRAVFDEACAASTIANSIKAAVPVTFVLRGDAA